MHNSSKTYALIVSMLVLLITTIEVCSLTYEAGNIVPGAQEAIAHPNLVVLFQTTWVQCDA